MKNAYKYSRNYLLVLFCYLNFCALIPQVYYSYIFLIIDVQAVADLEGSKEARATPNKRLQKNFEMINFFLIYT